MPSMSIMTSYPVLLPMPMGTMVLAMAGAARVTMTVTRALALLRKSPVHTPRAFGRWPPTPRPANGPLPQALLLAPPPVLLPCPLYLTLPRLEVLLLCSLGGLAQLELPTTQHPSVLRRLPLAVLAALR